VGAGAVDEAVVGRERVEVGWSAVAVAIAAADVLEGENEEFEPETRTI
jgi:hypothetical protein